MADVRLVDLDVFKQFSLALRREFASADEVLRALDASRAVVVAALGAADELVTDTPANAGDLEPPADAVEPEPASFGADDEAATADGPSAELDEPDPAPAVGDEAAAGAGDEPIAAVLESVSADDEPTADE